MEMYEVSTDYKKKKQARKKNGAHKYFVKLLFCTQNVEEPMEMIILQKHYLTDDVFHLSVVEAKSLNRFIKALDKFPEDRSIATCLSH